MDTIIAADAIAAISDGFSAEEQKMPTIIIAQNIANLSSEYFL